MLLLIDYLFLSFFRCFKFLTTSSAITEPAETLKLITVNAPKNSLSNNTEQAKMIIDTIKITIVKM